MILLISLIGVILNIGDTLKREINLENQKGEIVYICDSLTKYPFTVIIYSVKENAKLGKSIRLELEKGKRKDLKIFEVAKLDFIPNMGLFKAAIRAQFKIVKRKVLLDYDGIIGKEIGFEEGKLGVFIFKGRELKEKLFEDKKEVILAKIKDYLNENK